VGQPSERDVELLNQLNRLSLERTFTPQTDIDWSAETLLEEYGSLFSVTSLFAGTRFENQFSDAARAELLQYQQINLMRFTAQLERHGIAVLAQLYDADDSQPFTEYLGNFLKEEIYHYTMFTRAVDQIQASMPGARRLPHWRIDLAMRLLFTFVSWLPGRKLRATLTFRFFQFAEQLSIFVHHAVHKSIPREAGLINQVWSYHAIDEARHLSFDRMMLERNRLYAPFSWLATGMTAVCCILLALVANANEIWSARTLGVKVRLWNLPELLRSTTAPFKRRIQAYLHNILKGDHVAAPPVDDEREAVRL
jgi:hypothetical protein